MVTKKRNRNETKNNEKHTTMPSTKKKKIAKPLTEEQKIAMRKSAAKSYEKRKRLKEGRIKYRERQEKIGPVGPLRDQQRKTWREDKRKQRAKQIVYREWQRLNLDVGRRKAKILIV